MRGSQRGEGSDLLLTGARLVTADADLSPAWVAVAGGRITASGTGRPPAGDGVDLRGLLVLPGLVDVHQHGGGGGAYPAGAESAARAAAFHRHAGTTTSVASLVSAPPAALAGQLRALVPLVDDGTLAGLHLEGPWLSALRRGAHPAADLGHPTPGDVDALLAAGQGRLRMVTLAPELPGALDAVARLVAAGVVAALGHTDASYEVTREALAAGARAATHLFNGMRPVHHREPGPVVALLESDAAIELVADGVHLHAAVLADTMALAGPDRAVLVTDAMAATGMPDGRYRLGAREVTVQAGVARGPDGEIAGSTVTLADALRYAVTVAGVPLQAAVAAATATPARLLGLTDVGHVGPGAQADLTVLTPRLEVVGVLVRGRWVRTPPGLPIATGTEA